MHWKFYFCFLGVSLSLPITTEKEIEFACYLTFYRFLLYTRLLVTMDFESL